MGLLTFERARAAVLAVLALLTVAFLVTLVPGVRPHAGFVVAYDGWLQGVAYVAIGLGALAAVVDRLQLRPFWSVLAAALVVRAAGFVLFLTVVRGEHPRPTASVADLAWILSGLLLRLAMCIGIVRVAPQLTAAIALDGLVAALTTTGLAVMATDSTFQILMGAGATPSSSVHVVYPSIDAALLVLTAALAFAVGDRMPGAGRLAIAGLLGFCVVDLVNTVEVAHGTD